MINIPPPVLYNPLAKVEHIVVHASRQIGTQAFHKCPLLVLCFLAAAEACKIADNLGVFCLAGSLSAPGADAEDVIEEQEARPAEAKVDPKSTRCDCLLPHM